MKALSVLYCSLIFLNCTSFLMNSTPERISCDYNSLKAIDEFIIKDIPPNLRKYGYTNFLSNPLKGTDYPPYNDGIYNGKKAKIIDMDSWQRFIIITENCDKIYAYRFACYDKEKKKIRGTIIINDFNEASKLLNKNIWVRKYQDNQQWENFEKVTMVEMDITSNVDPFEIIFITDSKIIHRIPFNQENILSSSPFKSSWSKDIIDSIKQKKIMIGMSKEQAFLAWGYPKKINKSVSMYSTMEQCIYGRQYLYFNNGILTSFQDY